MSGADSGGADSIGSNSFSSSVRLSLAEDGRLLLSNVDGQPFDPRTERHIRDGQRSQLAAWLEVQCATTNAGIDEILRIHRGTPSPRQAFQYALVPFADILPIEPPPLKLGVIDRLFRGRQRRREEEYAEGHKRYQGSLQDWEAASDAHKAEQERLRHRWEEERFTSISVMQELLEVALHAIPWPRETLVGFDFADGGKLLQLDVDLPEVEDMPTRSAEVAARGLKLNIHDRSQAQIRQEYMTHIHGVLFRVVGEAFATLPAVQTIECSGFSQRIDPATGHEQNNYLVSVRVLRGQWEQIDFDHLDQVDPMDSLDRFELRRDSTASGILRPIAPFAVHVGTSS